MNKKFDWLDYISFNSYKGTIVIILMKKQKNYFKIASIPIKEQLLLFKIPGKNKQKTASIPIKEQLLFKMIYKKDTIEDMLQFL